MKMTGLDHHIEILTKGALQSLNNGVQFVSLEVEYAKVQRSIRVMFTVYLMLTIASARHHTGFIDTGKCQDPSLEQFIHCLGYCQLDAFFELQLHR